MELTGKFLRLFYFSFSFEEAEVKAKKYFEALLHTQWKENLRNVFSNNLALITCQMKNQKQKTHNLHKKKTKTLDLLLT